MIRFQNVRGDVFVDDRRIDDRVMARDGLVLKPMGDYLIVTTQGSSADIQAIGKVTHLGPLAFLRIGPRRFLQGQHGEHWIPRNTKAFLAKAWRLAGGRV